jgi:DNA-binding transcriptional MocR family regulator
MKPEPIERHLYDTLEFIMNYKNNNNDRTPYYQQIADGLGVCKSVILGRIAELKRRKFIERHGRDLFIVKVPKPMKPLTNRERISLLEGTCRGLVEEIDRLDTLIDGQRHRIEVLDGKVARLERGVK